MEGKDIVRRLKANNGELTRKLLKEFFDFSDLQWDVDEKFKALLRKYSSFSGVPLVFVNEIKNEFFVEKNKKRYYVVNIEEDRIQVKVYSSAQLNLMRSLVIEGNRLEELFAKEFGMEYVEYIEKYEKEKLQETLDNIRIIRENGISQKIKDLTKIANQTNG